MRCRLKHKGWTEVGRGPAGIPRFSVAEGSKRFGPGLGSQGSAPAAPEETSPRGRKARVHSRPCMLRFGLTTSPPAPSSVLMRPMGTSCPCVCQALGLKRRPALKQKQTKHDSWAENQTSPWACRAAGGRQRGLPGGGEEATWKERYEDQQRTADLFST